MTLTADGVILYSNSRFADLLRCPLLDLLGRPMQDFLVKESRLRFEALLRGGLDAEVQDAFTLQPCDGPAVPAYLGVSALAEGALGLCLMVTDLTERRHYQELQQAQEALRASEERLASDLAAAERLQEISSSLIREDDVDQLYHQFLDAAVGIMRSDMASLQAVAEDGGALDLLAYRGFDAEFGRTFARVGPETRTSCSVAWQLGRRVVVPDVETCDFIVGTPALEQHRQTGIRAVQSTPLISRGGQLLGMISTHWKTPHQPAERDLRLLDVLARQAADLIEQRRAEQALRDADRNKDEFLATLAHELRNPLAPIRNATLILQSQGQPNPELHWARGVIERQVQLMARLLEDLLDVSRLSRSRMELRTELIELAVVLEAAMETSRPLIEGAGHQLTVALPPEPVYLEADPVRLAQVFANLLNNAAKYTDPGGQIRLEVERRRSDVIVSIADTGIGIAPELLPRIFEIYSQAKSASARSLDGLGIGLSLARGLVELHGGSITVRSDGPGQGSTFVVCLPVAVAPSIVKPVRPNEDSEQVSRVKYRILVVDDNRDSADSLAMLLKIMGNEVSTSYDGQQAVEAGAVFRPDVVLLDIAMPKLNGYETCHLIRAQPWGKGVFLVALTGWGQEEDRRRSERTGFDDHMVKPVDAAALLKSLAGRPTTDRVSEAENPPAGGPPLPA
jgi:signal transduction histidine kinase/ActR/RegA family two-component response regulator